MNTKPEFGIIREGDEIKMTITEMYQRIKEDITFTRDKDLVGVPIRMSHAAKKYDINNATLIRWIGKGFIAIIRRGTKLLEIDEADIKMASQIYHKAKEYLPPRKAAWVLKEAMGKAGG